MTESDEPKQRRSGEANGVTYLNVWNGAALLVADCMFLLATVEPQAYVNWVISFSTRIQCT